MFALTVLFAQAVLVQALILGLFRLRGVLGLIPLAACLGVFQVLQTFSSTVLVDLGGGVSISPGSTLLFTSSLFAVLLVYIREDALRARKIIIGLVVANIVAGILMASISLLLNHGSAQSTQGVPAIIFGQSATILVLGTVLLFVDSLLIPLVYELLGRSRLRLFPRIFSTMLLVLSFDSLLFVSAVFAADDAYWAILRSSLLGKGVTALMFSAVFSLYLWRFEREPLPRPKGASAVRDLLAVLTYREKYELLQKFAYRDALTGVYNRGHFDEALVLALAQGKRSGTPTSLLMLDLDHFKQINDRHGHLMGDRVLRRVAAALGGALRASDQLCRYGGEEFAVILANSYEDSARLVAEKLRTEVEALTVTASPPIRLSCTIGLATHPQAGETARDLIASADRRLYQGKLTGRNRVVATDDVPTACADDQRSSWLAAHE
jgi:diguanylate cyclase (GGDEF)-like protein